MGEHCARVAQIYCEVFGLPRAEVLFYCLHHDSGELLSGDTPFMAKKLSRSLKLGCEEVERQGRIGLGIILPLITDEETRRVKLADLLEMYEFGHVERTLGSHYGEPVERDTMSAAIELATVDEAEMIRRWVRENNSAGQ